MLDDLEHGWHLPAEACRDDLRAVVVALGQDRTLAVAAAGDAWRVGRLVVRGAALRADPAPCDATDELLGGDVDVDHAPDALAVRGEGLVERARLADGAREAVQDRASRGDRPRELVHEHADRDVVRHQLPTLHVFARRLAQRRLVGHGGTEEVARGEVRQRELARQVVRLGPLSGAHRADEQKDEALADGSRRIGHRMKPS